MTTDDNTRSAAIALLASGQATQSEVAELAAVSRQLVRYWANAEGLDVPALRRAWLLKAWQKVLRRKP
jgi:hypothetical protein